MLSLRSRTWSFCRCTV